jgi:large subunit ribosomal protein L20
MPRVSHVVASLKRKKRVFKKTRGFWGGRSRLYRTAFETLRRSMVFATRDRRDKKGDFRRLWIVRINAACKEHGISYSRFIDGLKKANVKIDRKVLAELAVNDNTSFSELVKIAKAKPKASKK